MNTLLSIIAALPVRFWVYSFVLTFFAGSMTGAAKLPLWTAAVAGAATGAIALAVVLVLLLAGVTR